MLSTKDKIIQASLDVFSKKGYLAATTLEISKQAGVSEMTLFRHFTTKENLFLTTVKKSIGKSIITDDKLDFNVSFNEFVLELMHQKFLLISKNIQMIKMLVRESLSNILTDELNFPKMINKEVLSIFEKYILHNKIDKDPKVITEILVGILLRYAVMNDDYEYFSLTEKEQKAFLEKYINMLKI